MKAAATISTPSDREVRIVRVVDAPMKLVFAAWTDPRHVPRWLLGPPGWTMPVCEIDLRVGGRWRYVWRKSAGEEMEMSGSYKEVTPPTRLVTTERWGPEWPETVNTLQLTEAGGKTTMTLTILYVSKDARDAALKSGMKDGVEQSYARLDEAVSAMAKER